MVPLCARNMCVKINQRFVVPLAEPISSVMETVRNGCTTHVSSDNTNIAVFDEERQKCIGNFPVYPDYPDIRQVQKLLKPENFNDLKKITQFIGIIMKIFEHRNG